MTPFAAEAISALGYIKPGCEHLVSRLLILCVENHPKAVATSFRKHGSQITKAEKKALGIRANAFMSYDAVDMLTPRGLASPLEALETTLLRAVFSHFRAVKLATPIPAKHAEIRYDPPFKECGACWPLNKQRVDIAAATPFPLVGCFREACPLTYSVYIDYIGELVEQERGRR
ncbi:hypothetical protein ASE05_10520 [Mesorhizobium sp. Root172]|nr:hypothetical protein ASE05_10520 [Mesorhizobium sp. Root172]